MFEFLKLFFSPDDSGGGGGDNNPAPTPTPEPPTDPAPADPQADELPVVDPPEEDVLELPKYSSQLDPKKRESDDYKNILYKHKTLNEVADDYVALNKRLEKAIEIPGKDAAPEEIKAFFKKLGVPETEEGYDLPANGLDENMAKPLSAMMRKEFMRSGMTKTQGKAMWNLIVKNYVAGNQAIEDHKVKQAETFDARMEAMFEKSHPVKADRDGAMKETISLLTQHINRTGLGKVYKDAGLLYNPDFVVAIAKDEKARSGSSYVTGKGVLPEEKSMGTFGGDYHSDFKKYGEK